MGSNFFDAATKRPTSGTFTMNCTMTDTLLLPFRRSSRLARRRAECKVIVPGSVR